MKIVINAQYGGFGLSKLATEEYLKLKGKKSYFYSTECDGRKIYYKKIIYIFIRACNKQRKRRIRKKKRN